jgi:hypothetical protein
MITLKTLGQASAQEVAEQVARHLLTQGKKCKAGDPASTLGCKYRLGELKCAAGCLIAGDEYKEEMEGKDWDCLIERGFVPKDHDSLIESLQNIHDRESPGSWPALLPEVFDDLGLAWTDELKTLGGELEKKLKK